MISALHRFFLLSLLILTGLSPAMALAQPGTSQLSDFINKGRSVFVDSNEDNILPPEQAFKLSVEFIAADTLQADFQIAPGHYLYKDKIKFTIESDHHQFGSITLPSGDWKEDPTFGKTEVFHHDFAALIKLALASPNDDKTHNIIKISATYQGCSEKGLCYPPINKTFELDAAHPTTSILIGSPAEQDESTKLLASGNMWLIILGFFGFGLLLSLTPCVLPMIPILSAIIVGSKHTGRLHSFNLSLAYTLGMALSYTAAGVAAGLSGQLLSAALQNAWVLGASALVFILLALSMFGFYEIRLPASLETRMMQTSQRFKGGHLLGVFAMGVLGALIVSPCVAAPLAGALVYIGQTQDIVLGGTALFALSIGMGVPLLLIGASAGAILPKAGPWMSAVRQLFGVIMLAVAVWIVSPLIPTSLQLLIWAALLIVPAIFMRALDRLPDTASGWTRFWKGIAIIMLLLGTTLVIGAASGAKSALHPLEGLRIAPDRVAALPFQRIKDLAALDHQLQQHPDTLVMLDFYADWCVACKEMEQFTFSDPKIRARLDNIVLLQADVTKNDTGDQALLKRFGLYGPPGIIFFNGKGEEIRHARVIGYQNVGQFEQSLVKVQHRND
ncbi:protein-disulfide reductase DsbD [Methylobacillus gramineus]|uniref:protein-disulfide reductase DsbD n=1 Tax=Methylobacillus gramineus TaxID=755169 RepID=UPI001CFF85C0|nr:protein-disulfide reductase DsbD [Methylobacillus gramineus]MCB5185685.1 protein-disulfide reductase DsbD [Methylobacillus gramineus]